MATRGYIIAAIIVAPIAALLAAYVGLINDGSVPPPNWSAISIGIGLGTATAAKIVFVLALAVLAVLAAIAPTIYAVRSNDLVTILISLTMTGIAFAILVMSRTVMDQISALIVYLANVVLCGLVYTAHRIAPQR